MRAVWIDAGNNPNTDLLKAHGITRDYYDVRDARRARFAISRGRGAQVGVYADPTWFPDLPVDDFARLLSQDLHDLGVDNEQCAVHVNAEAHNFDIGEFLFVWRGKRPTRDTAWVLEGLQGGRLARWQVLEVNADTNLQLLAEAYAGDMSPLPGGPDRVRSNLVAYGIERKRALVMYDAKTLTPSDWNWDGCAFTQGRLRA
jgi:hypothetical protein